MRLCRPKLLHAPGQGDKIRRDRSASPLAPSDGVASIEVRSWQTGLSPLGQPSLQNSRILTVAAAFGSAPLARLLFGVVMTSGWRPPTGAAEPDGDQNAPRAPRECPYGSHPCSVYGGSHRLYTRRLRRDP